MSAFSKIKLLKYPVILSTALLLSALTQVSVNADEGSILDEVYASYTQPDETDTGEVEYIPEESVSDEDDDIAEDIPATEEPEEKFGWNEDNEGRKYYLSDDGIRLTGYQTIDGSEYYFAANGIMKSGWYTIDGIRMYFSPETGERQYGWIDYNSNRYYTDETGKCTGLQIIDGKLYIFDSFGILRYGWTEYDGNKYYSGETGELFTGEQEIDGIKYLFSSKGKFKSGWQTVDGIRIFYDYSEALPVYGWIKYNKCIYYADDITGKYTGDQIVSGLKYRFSDEGILCTGFQQFSDGTRYYKNDGSAVKGFFKLGGKTYYFDNNYVMKTGFQIIESNRYYFDKDGVMLTGWQTISGKKYYFDKNGVMLTGWQTMDSKKYYFDKNGVMQTGWQTIDGKKYFFNENGVMENGYWKTAGGNKSYVSADGSLCKNGVFLIDDAYYCFDANGIMLTGWQKYGNDYYLFDRLNGQRQAGCTTDGITIQKDGRAVIDAWSKSKIETMMTAHRIMLEQTKPTDSMEEKRLKCFNWVMSFPYRRYRILSEVYKENDWEMTFANDIFTYHQGCCVAEASATAFLFREIGYTDVAVSHDTGHAWTEIGKYLYDPLLAEAREFDRYYNVLKPADKLTYERRVIG